MMYEGMIEHHKEKTREYEAKQKRTSELMDRLRGLSQDELKLIHSAINEQLYGDEHG